MISSLFLPVVTFGAHLGLDQQSSCEKELGSASPPLPFLLWLFQLNLQHWPKVGTEYMPGKARLSNSRWGKAPWPGNQRTHSSRGAQGRADLGEGRGKQSFSATQMKERQPREVMPMMK